MNSLAEPVYAESARPGIQVVIPFTRIVGWTDASNNAKVNPTGGYKARLTNVSEYKYNPIYHANQLGDTALVNGCAFWDSRPGGLDISHMPSPDPGGGKAVWWAGIGEWASYQFGVDSPGTYSIVTRFGAEGPKEPTNGHIILGGFDGDATA